jgi:hypothetical protein
MKSEGKNALDDRENLLAYYACGGVCEELRPVSVLMIRRYPC